MKLMKILVAMLVMAAMAVPVIAEDRLSLSGQMRVRGWHTDYDFADNTQTWADQRLRVGGKIAVAEGVSITFRTDITESDWGGGGFGSGRSGSYQQWDRAHIDLTKGNFHLRAGQQYIAYGKTYALDTQDNGVSVNYKFGDVPVNVFLLVQDNNEVDGQHTAAKAQETDAFLSGLKVSPKFGDIATNFFVGNYNDSGVGFDVNTNHIPDANVTLIGADVTIPLDAFKIVAELDFFTGDSGDLDDNGKQLDAYGTQLYLDGSMAVSDAFTLGGQFFWAEGDDEDVQYTGIGNRFGGWDPVYDVGTSLSNEKITFGRVFNIAELAAYENEISTNITSAGVVGARLYTSFKASQDLSFGASAGYFESEEDKIADIDVVALAAGLVYKVMPNTTLQLQLQYTDGTINETAYTRDLGIVGDTDFDAFRAGTGLFVNF